MLFQTSIFYMPLRVSPTNPASIYLFKVNNRNTRKDGKMKNEKNEFIVNFEHIYIFFLCF